jgi:hypothetical protein
MADIQTITLLGRSHAVTLPDFAAAEELLAALGETKDGAPSRRLRAMSAIVGLCTRVGRESGADYAAHRFDALAYGGEVYSWLRGRKASPSEIATAALTILGPLTDSLFPREQEVTDAMGKSAVDVAS